MVFLPGMHGLYEGLEAQTQRHEKTFIILLLQLDCVLE